MTISNVQSNVSITVYFKSSCSCPKGGTLQSDGTCDIITYDEESYCKSCWVTTGGTGEWCCDEEDDECSAPSSDYYGGHYNDYWQNGGWISYYCYYYDEEGSEEYVTSCSQCGTGYDWDCPSGTSLTYDGSSYGICSYNASC